MRSLSICSALVILLLAGVSSSAATLDEVIDRHIAAHGGLESWQAVTSMSFSGSYTAFSRVKPFSLVRTRDRRYLLDHYLDEKHIVIGFDGKQAWWINPWYGIDWAIPVTGPDRIALERNLDFYPTPLFDYQEQGLELRLAETTELDGQEVLQIEVTRADGSEETWYLDTETYLEVARDSPGSDFGSPMPQRTYFDDFRTVGDLVIAHYIESEWYTRNHVMEIDTVELNAAIDDIGFAQPPPTGMEQLQDLVGTWSVKVEDRPGSSAAKESELTMTITSRVGGALIEARYIDNDGIELISSLTYDRFQKVYRLTRVSSFTTHLDIQEGSFEEGVLKLDDMESGTYFVIDGRGFNEATVISNITENGFVEERQLRADGSERWVTNQRLTYTRSDQGASE